MIGLDSRTVNNCRPTFLGRHGVFLDSGICEHVNSGPLILKVTDVGVAENDLDHIANHFQYSGKLDCEVQTWRRMSESIQTVEDPFLSQANAIRNIGILPVIGYHRVAGACVKSDRLGLFEACLEYKGGKAELG